MAKTSNNVGEVTNGNAAQVKGTEKEGKGITRRQLLQWSAAAGAVVAVGLPKGARGAVCTGLNAIEAWPVSPLILKPFVDPLPVPTAYQPETAASMSTWAVKPSGALGCQDSDSATHQLWPGQTGTVCEGMPQPIVYKATLKVAAHQYSTSAVRNLVTYGTKANQKAGAVITSLPATTIYGFNGGFPGPMINAEYGKPIVFRIQNDLANNPLNLDRGDFGSWGEGYQNSDPLLNPQPRNLIHLHNGHTASESDGNPHNKEEAYGPGGWVDNLYLNYPAGGDDAEKQSFLWFHDHREGHTGANVYKGMAGLYPIYDPKIDSGDETAPGGLGLPGRRTTNANGTFNVKYDIPLAIGDVALDDGLVPHQDFHNGCGESHPEWWGKSFFRHFPNHGFVGDIFWVNGKAYPTLTVERRRYRFRFLTAAISRQFELSFMKSKAGPKAAVDLGYKGADLQGQWRIEDGVQCLQMAQIATGGGLIPQALIRDNIENWPGMRHEVVVDFTKYMDGTATKTGEVIYLTNTGVMPDGRQLTRSIRMGNADPKYKIPLLKIVIGANPTVADQSKDIMAVLKAGKSFPLRPAPALPSASALAALPQRQFDLQRGSAGGEIQWLINGVPFDKNVPLATMKQGQPEVWTITNGGGWSHPMHFHQEEHQVLTRNGKPAATVPGHQDDTGKDDIIAQDAAEIVTIYRNFRTFKGKYVAHCHNLAHEDHAMMFGWTIE